MNAPPTDAPTPPAGRTAAAPPPAWLATLLIPYRAVRLLFTVGGFFCFYLGSVILSWTVVPLIKLGRPDPVELGKRSRRIARAAFRLFHGYLRVMQLIHFRPRDAALALPPGPCVIIANHPTLIDVTALLATLDDTCVVAKGSLFRSLMVGRFVRACRFIDAKRGSATDGAGVMIQAAERLAEGSRVLIFPEGTRSPAGGPGELKRGAFELAARANVPLVVLLVRCEPTVLSREVPWWWVPPLRARMTITQLPSLGPAELRGTTRRLARAVHATYARCLSAEPEDGHSTSTAGTSPTWEHELGST